MGRNVRVKWDRAVCRVQVERLKQRLYKKNKVLEKTETYILCRIAILDSNPSFLHILFYLPFVGPRSFLFPPTYNTSSFSFNFSLRFFLIHTQWVSGIPSSIGSAGKPLIHNTTICSLYIYIYIYIYICTYLGFIICEISS